MNLEKAHQDGTEMSSLDEVENNDLKLSKDTTNIEKEKCSCKKHKCKFANKISASVKLAFWVGMLILVIILGYASFKEAIVISGAISDKLDGVVKDESIWDDMSVGFMIFESIFLWIEALFYVVIFSWSVYGTTKNGIIVGKKNKAKKRAKLETENKTTDGVSKNKKAKKSKKSKKDNSSKTKKNGEAK